VRVALARAPLSPEARAAEAAAEERRRAADSAERVGPLSRALGAAAEEIARRGASLEERAVPRLVALAKAEGRYDLERIVRECLALARGGERGAVVALHPADLAAAEEAGWGRGEGLPPAVVLKADPAVERGGCRVETPYGNVLREPAKAVQDVFAAVDGRR
jgi:flagellar biosynthesis/type III secretory pathway protein FliH